MHERTWNILLEDASSSNPNPFRKEFLAVMLKVTAFQLLEGGGVKLETATKVEWENAKKCTAACLEFVFASDDEIRRWREGPPILCQKTGSEEG